MTCPRCLSDRARRVASAPDRSGAWEFYHCETCHFGWRSTEPPEVIDPEEPEMLEDLLMASLNEAMRKADETAEREMNKLTGGLNIPGMGGMF